MKDKEDDQHEEYAQSADTKAFLKLVDAMFITGKREGEMPKYPIPLNFILRNRTTTKYGFSKK